MPLSTLTSIVLRLFAIKWCAMFILTFLGAFAYSGYDGGRGAALILKVAAPFVVPVSYGVLALIAWVFSDRIALKVAGSRDYELRLGRIGAARLYTFGILAIGLWFFLSHLGGMLNLFHHLALNRAGHRLIPDDRMPLYDFSGALIPCLAGGALAFFSPQLGRKAAAATKPSGTGA